MAVSQHFGTSSHRKHGTYYGIARCMVKVDRGTMRHLTLIINMSIYGIDWHCVSLSRSKFGSWAGAPILVDLQPL